jgi:hypothetical protein
MIRGDNSQTLFDQSAEDTGPNTLDDSTAVLPP